MAIVMQKYRLELEVNPLTGVVTQVRSHPIKGSTELPNGPGEPDPGQLHSPDGPDQTSLDAIALKYLSADKTRMGL